MRVVLLLLFSTMWWSACQPNANTSSKPLQIAVAANMQFAMEALEAAFEAKHGIVVNVVIGSSGKLAAQIKQGAPYDLLLSANMKYPNYLQAEGLAATPPEVYAFGELVLWTTLDIPLDSLPQVLSTPIIKKIGLANPRNAPYGEAAKQYLRTKGQWNTLQDKLVFGENIAQVNQYVLSGACTLGFTAKSVVLSPNMRGRGRWVSLSANAYTPIAQGVVQTTYGAAEHALESATFLQFLKSEEAKVILEQYGYTINLQ
ncbi:MAG: molybdate ABC transporter substrate-binding protein [Bacteroidota bacterium]